MRRIFKYQLDVVDRQVVRAPRGWKPLSVGVQRDMVCIWASVDPDAEVVDHVFWIHGTGHRAVAVEVGAEFLGTVLLHGGDLVFHVFVAKETP